MKRTIVILALLLPGVATADIVGPPPTNNVANLLYYHEQVISIARHQAEAYAYCLGHDDALRGMGYETGLTRVNEVLNSNRAGDWMRRAALVPVILETFYDEAKALGEVVNRNQPVVDECFAKVAAVETAIASGRTRGVKKPGKGK